ncbi:MAG: Gfo/Idh/MocA family oxidoreductase [Verrucomicrobiae bacterium]|nr:Gfo/Idh/MocA family oxidoreductase [Verrucomicrobiae bacterium]
MKPIPNPSRQGGPLPRRQFLSQSGRAVAGAALAGALPRAGYTAESHTLDVALIGCGGRGTGAAAQAMATQGPVRLRAMADFFERRLSTSLEILRAQSPDRVDVPPDRRFVGLDGYRQAMDSLSRGSVVILATPPAFRPIHLEYAVARGLHVFMEKSFAVDGPGIRRILAAGEEAERRNLKIAGGLMTRHSAMNREAVQRIHDGAIGNVVTVWPYRVHGTVKTLARDPGWNELAWQIANYSSFTWLNGSFLVDWLIHNIDVACWVKDDWPVSVQGMGGRQVRDEPDQLFDHYMAEYTFRDGTRMVAQGRLIDGCWEFFGVQAHGSHGCAVLGEGVPLPRLFRGHQPTPENRLWQFGGERNDPYQTEHDLLFDAIRNDRPWNETRRCAFANLAAIMGRMACESGQRITWEDALNSNLELAPNLDALTPDSPPPVMPDARGRYPIAMPGRTRAV